MAAYNGVLVSACTCVMCVFANPFEYGPLRSPLPERFSTRDQLLYHMKGFQDADTIIKRHNGRHSRFRVAIGSFRQISMFCASISVYKRLDAAWKGPKAPQSLPTYVQSLQKTLPHPRHYILLWTVVPVFATRLLGVYLCRDWLRGALQPMAAGENSSNFELWFCAWDGAVWSPIGTLIETLEG